LAAGSSSRLGSPKQLLEYNNQSLLQHAIAVALEPGIGPVVTVLGSNHDLLEKKIPHNSIDIVFNKEWQEGIASSIRCGLNFLLNKYPTADAAVFMVCDQPFISASLIKELLAAQQQTGKPIAASKYAGDIGTPALFHQSMFADLLQLKGDSGARKIIRQHAGSTASVSFPQGDIDIDTPADFSNFLKNGL